MGILNKFKTNGVITRKHEEKLYALVASEMAEGTRNSALWLKALEIADGNSEKQIAEYIKLRVQSLKDDIHIINSIEKSTSVERPCLRESLDIEDLITMIEEGVSISYILQSLTEKLESDITLIINQLDACEQYPLHVAVKHKRKDIVNWLLKAGANYNYENYWGQTPLDIALKQENTEMISLIESYIKSSLIK